MQTHERARAPFDWRWIQARDIDRIPVAQWGMWADDACADWHASSSTPSHGEAVIIKAQAPATSHTHTRHKRQAALTSAMALDRPMKRTKRPLLLGTY